MRRGYLILTLLVCMFLTMIPEQANAADTLLVPWTDGTQIFVDTLRKAIEKYGDAKIYKLQAGGYYWITETMNIDFPLVIVGEEPTSDLHPAIIQMVSREDGSIAGQLMNVSNSLTLMNVAILGCDENGVQTYYFPIDVSAENCKFYMKNVIFEREKFGIILYAGKNNDIIYEDCKFRHFGDMFPDQQWLGQTIRITTDQDTVIVENCTYLNIMFTPFQLEGGAGNYVRFNHNTIVNMGRSLNAGAWWKEAYFTNLLLINPFWHGQTKTEYTSETNYDPERDDWVDAVGFFTVGDLPSRYGTEEGRRILFGPVAAWRDPKFAEYYTKEGVADGPYKPQPFLSNFTRKWYFGEEYIQRRVLDTLWLAEKPNFDADVDDWVVDSMIACIEGLREGISPSTEWAWGIPTDEAGDVIHTDILWPLPEDFHYTQPAELLTKGTDGLPLGDLNWFPDKKADWEANKDAYVAWIEALPGNKIIEQPIATIEAEDGNVSDGAEVATFEGEAWYTLEPGSSIEWTFDSDYEGPIDMKMKARADGVNIGFDFILNGHNIVDAARKWGQLVVWTGSDDPQTFWTGKSTDEFYEAFYATAELHCFDGSEYIALVSGQNTLKLQYSWNPISFQWVEFYEPGTENLIVHLDAKDAVSYNATPGGSGAWVPSSFKSVDLGTNGTVSFTVNLENAGEYKVRVFYCNSSGADATGSISVDGTVIENVTFKYDTTGTDLTTGAFSADAGSHEIAITGSSTKIDLIQIISKTEIEVGIKEDNNLAKQYRLDQNYPNPFNPTTTIGFYIEKPQHVKLNIYNMLGQRVATMLNRHMNAGYHAINFDAGNLPSGIYFYQLEAGKVKLNRKMVVLK
ncbi:MAG: T9SS type A sorting domain-containing protein [Candidatus Marinimicrobia bacterium]|nr:T9SS type A sorting domain-containing protein [Candidatus Neomarinimicrobiota bacterium]